MLALAALALQLVLSFGHIHPGDIFRPGASTLAGAVTPAPSTPQPQPPTLPDHDGCAICASMAMAASSALPAPVLLLPPSLTGRASQPLPLPPIVASAPRPPFQTRAPPAA
ncbi:MAG TPA: hypothetical protein VN802_03905 [Stellaceae bacterium]|nr:hypothetical protein [Stellaceae bacterium]